MESSTQQTVTRGKGSCCDLVRANVGTGRKLIPTVDIEGFYLWNTGTSGHMPAVSRTSGVMCNVVCSGPRDPWLVGGGKGVDFDDHEFSSNVQLSAFRIPTAGPGPRPRLQGSPCRLRTQEAWTPGPSLPGWFLQPQYQADLHKLAPRNPGPPLWILASGWPLWTQDQALPVEPSTRPTLCQASPTDSLQVPVPTADPVNRPTPMEPISMSTPEDPASRSTHPVT